MKKLTKFTSNCAEQHLGILLLWGWTGLNCHRTLWSVSMLFEGTQMLFAFGLCLETNFWSDYLQDFFHSVDKLV